MYKNTFHFSLLPPSSLQIELSVFVYTNYKSRKNCFCLKINRSHLFFVFYNPGRISSPSISNDRSNSRRCEIYPEAFKTQFHELFVIPSVSPFFLISFFLFFPLALSFPTFLFAPYSFFLS